MFPDGVFVDGFVGASSHHRSSALSAGKTIQTKQQTLQELTEIKGRIMPDCHR